MYVIIQFQGRELERLVVDSLDELYNFDEFQIIAPEPEQWFERDLEHATVDNPFYRRVVKTGKYHQIVLMSLEPGEEIGWEEHDTDQFIRVESGDAEIQINGGSYQLANESAINIEAGQRHNVVNVGEKPLKLYTIYSPPHHPKGLIQPRKDK